MFHSDQGPVLVTVKYVIDPPKAAEFLVWSKYSTGQFSARSRMMHGHHAKQKMGAVVGLCNRSGKPAVAAAKRIPGGREPDLAITPSHPSAAVRSGEIHPG